jgi:hypothetical protein
MKAAGLYETSDDFNRTNMAAISTQNVKHFVLFFFKDGGFRLLELI